MIFSMDMIDNKERIEPSLEEIELKAKFYKERLIIHGYKDMHSESHDKIARFFALVYLSVQNEIKPELKRYSKPQKGLMIFGPVGVGKTFAMQILSAMFKIHFVNADELMQQYGKKGEAGFWDHVEMFDGRDVIVDDLCSERALKSYGNESVMIDFLSRRERQYKNEGVLTMFTTNAMNWDELAKSYGDRIVSRIRGMCEPVLVQGEDLRPRGAK